MLYGIAKMEGIIKEVDHSLAVEHMTMTEDEKGDYRKAGCGELSYHDPVSQYVAAEKQSASHG